MRHHHTEIQNPPFTVGQHVRVLEDGEGGEIYLVIGMNYEYRPGSHVGWSFNIATESEIENGYGSTDGFGPEHLTSA
jgi:hypothetical protein